MKKRYDNIVEIKNIRISSRRNPAFKANSKSGRLSPPFRGAYDTISLLVVFIAGRFRRTLSCTCVVE